MDIEKPVKDVEPPTPTSQPTPLIVPQEIPQPFIPLMMKFHAMAYTYHRYILFSYISPFRDMDSKLDQ